MRTVVVVLLLAMYVSGQGVQSPARTSVPNASNQPKFTLTVTDENGVAVASARIQLEAAPPAATLRCETDFAGHCTFVDLSSGTYELTIEKQGFYALTQSIKLGTSPNLDVSLSHQREVRQVVNVTESAPAIDPAQVSTKEELTGTEIINIPYPSSHDYRQALFFMPGITPDQYGQPHIAGAETYQTLVLLDGFNVTQPSNGELLVRSSIESFRSVEITPSREPAEYGKGSGGVLDLNTKMGDDHFHATSTDFTPSVQDVAGKGISLSQWTPIVTVSGPVRKGKMWFLNALSGNYQNIVVQQLPSSQDSDHIWQMDNLAKLQSNITTRNILTASFLSNYYHDEYDGLSVLQPQSTTPTDDETAYIGSIKDQYYFRNGALLETGFGVDQYTLAFTPQGNAPYIETTGVAGGNYYLNESTLVRRIQALSNLYLPPRHWQGRHDVKMGIDLDRLNYKAQFLRNPISFLQPNAPLQACATGANGVPVPPFTCARYSVFTPGTYSTIFNTEFSGYFEDKWLITNRFLIEPGLRFDEDQIVRTPLLSPRLAGTYILDDDANTKLSAGVGILYDATTLGIIHQPMEGQRSDYFFESTGPTDENGNSIPAPTPVSTYFTVNRSMLQAPRYLNWSLGLEKKLPHLIFLKLEFMQKRGTHGFAYNTIDGAISGDFLLANGRNDRFDAFTISARHRFRQYYEIFSAYTRSTSHTNQVFDFSVDIPLLSPQLPGPYPWDAPNRFVGYGITPFFKLPILHKVDLVYSTEARTGLPFLATTDQGRIYPGDSPGKLRLPAFYTINMQLEKRFHLFGRYWALRGGFDNITNHGNPVVANGVLDAAHPNPTFVDANSRAFTSRIRYLGKD